MAAGIAPTATVDGSAVLEVLVPHDATLAAAAVAAPAGSEPRRIARRLQWLTWGAGPRASLNLILAAKAHAILQGRHHVSADDVAAVAAPVMRHRLIPNFAAQSEGTGGRACYH